MAAWVRPLLLLGGAKDGQMRFSRNVPWAVESAVAAAKFGARHAAVSKPVILVPGDHLFMPMSGALGYLRYGYESL